MKPATPIDYYYFTDSNHSPFYTDLRGYRDDITVLDNPHKGWYIHYVDNGFSRPKYRDDLSGPEDLKDIPGTKYLYLRMDWSDLEPAQGQYRFDRIDRVMEEYAPYGYRFMFRVCTFETAIDIPYATPKWVFDLGAKSIAVQNNFEPVYDDPIYLSHLDRFLQAFARHYDGHPLVESIDVGTFGSWGEGHTSFGSEIHYPAEAYQKHVDMHIRHFQKTRLTINYGIFVAIYDTDPPAARHMSEYAYAMGMALRDDSIVVPEYAEIYGYDTLITHDVFDRFYPTAPIDIEFAHYAIVKQSKWLQNGLPFIEALKRSHATFAGFHGYTTEWYREQPDLHRYLANRLGYWYFVDGFELPPAISHTKCVMRLAVRNAGYAPAYHAYRAKIVYRNGTDVYTVYDGEADNKNWLPDTPYTQSYALDLSAVPAGEYEVCFGLFEEDTPVYLAINQSLFEDGLYTLGTTVVS